MQRQWGVRQYESCLGGGPRISDDKSGSLAAFGSVAVNNGCLTVSILSMMCYYGTVVKADIDLGPGFSTFYPVGSRLRLVGPWELSNVAGAQTRPGRHVGAGVGTDVFDRGGARWRCGRTVIAKEPVPISTDY